MKFPNKYLRNLRPYRLASHKIWSVESSVRSRILKLDWNEATVPPSPLVAERLRSLMEEPSFFNLYPATYNGRLSERLSSYVGLPEENIQYFSGSDTLHEYLCKVYVGTGDPVMILGPSYDNFRLTCQANGAVVFHSGYTEDFTFDASRFESDIALREPSLVYICNPNNPTGNLHTMQYIESLLKAFPDTLFLIDEAYYEFSGLTVKDLVLRYDNVLISRTMSKAFALANFRIGYLIGSKDNVAFVNRIRNPKNISTFAQEAAVAALEDVPYMQKYVQEVLRAKTAFIGRMQGFRDHLQVFPGYGNFLLVRFKARDDKESLLRYLAGNNVFVRDTAQHPSVCDCFRITIGTEAQMRHAADVISRYYGQ